MGQVSHFPNLICTSHSHPPFSYALTTRLAVELDSSNANARSLGVSTLVKSVGYILVSLHLVFVLRKGLTICRE